MSTAATRFITQYRKESPEKAASIIYLVNIVSLLSGVFIVGFAYLFSDVIASRIFLNPKLTLSIQLGGVMLLMTSLTVAQQGIMLGFEAFKKVAIANLASGVSALVCCVAGVVLWDFTGLLVGFLISLTVAAIWHIASVLRISSKEGIWQSRFHPMSEWNALVKFSVPALLATAIPIPCFWFCNAYVARTPDGFTQLGIFEAANQWRLALLFVPAMLSRVNLPILTQLEHKNDRRKLKKLLLFSLLLNGGLTLVCCAPLIIFSEMVMSSFGPVFKSGSTILAVLSFSAVLTALNNVLTLTYISAGKMWLTFYLNLFWAVVLLACLYFLTPLLGVGLAYAVGVAASYGVLLLAQSAYTYYTYSSFTERAIA